MKTKIILSVVMLVLATNAHSICNSDSIKKNVYKHHFTSFEAGMLTSFYFDMASSGNDNKNEITGISYPLLSYWGNFQKNGSRVTRNIFASFQYGKTGEYKTVTKSEQYASIRGQIGSGYQFNWVDNHKKQVYSGSYIALQITETKYPIKSSIIYIKKYSNISYHIDLIGIRGQKENKNIGYNFALGFGSLGIIRFGIIENF